MLKYFPELTDFQAKKEREEEEMRKLCKCQERKALKDSYKGNSISNIKEYSILYIERRNV